MQVKLLCEADLTTDTFRDLYRWDLREHFAVDTKNYWAIHYRNRRGAILRAMSDFVPTGGSILDIGCAQATVALLLAERGFKVTAIDANHERLRYARLRWETGDINYVCMDGMRLSLKTSFDAILLGEVLEHVPQPKKLLETCWDMLHPGGIIVITTPNGLGLHNWLSTGYNPSTMESPDRANMPSGFGGRETHLFCLRPNQLRGLVLKIGLFIERQELLNSYVVNPLGLHKFFPLNTADGLNRFFSRIPILASFTTMTQFVVARKPTR